jgi:phage terminase small subunit
MALTKQPTTKKKATAKKKAAPKKRARAKAAPKKTKTTTKPPVLKTVHDKRHWRFACRYVELQHNGTQAYRAVYDPDGSKKLTDASCGANANRLLKDDKVREYVKTIERDALEAEKVTAEAVVARYNRWASFDPSQVFGWEMVEILDPEGKSYKPQRFKPSITIKKMEDVPPEAWECIESVSQGKDGFKINVVNRKGANDQLAKILGIEKQLIEHTGKNGAPIETVQLSKDEYAEVRQKMLDQDDC